MKSDSKTIDKNGSHAQVSILERTRGPLFVDMDGTLLATDALWEMLIQLIKTQPALLLRVPFWLVKGKAHFKRQLASHLSLNAALLPYHEPVVELLKRERDNGRELILATASDQSIADGVALHFGLFSSVLGSNGEVNLAGRAKLSAILQRTNGSAFDYIGNSWADVPIWQHASHAIIVRPSRRMISEASKTSTVEVVSCPRPSISKIIFRTLRVHQWSKNALLFVPLLLAHKISDFGRILDGLLAVVSFCLAASAVYIINDLLDLENDRKHPSKRKRPLAAGLVPIPTALAMAFLSLGLSVAVASVLLPHWFVATLLIYQATTMTYSFGIKRIAILDVFVLAGLYTIRVLAGAVAVDVPASPWFLAFSTFLFLSLAFVKRYGELRMAGNNGSANGFLEARGYQTGDIDLLGSVGASSGYVAVAVFALYINSNDVHLLYQRPALLWLIAPLILYWITRVWFLAHRGKMHDDPVVFALTDRHSYFLAGLITLLLGLATLK